MKKQLFSFLIIALNFTGSIYAQEQQEAVKDSIQNLDEVIIKANTILGNKYVAQNRTGASLLFIV